MATRLQRKLAEEIVKDVKRKRPRQKKELLVSSGYSELTADRNSKPTIEAIGVIKSLNDLGFTEDGAKKVVAEILYSNEAKHHDRLDAADKVFKVHGSYAPDRHLNVNVEVEALPEIRELTKKLNEIYRGASSGGDGGITGTLGDKAQD